MARVQIAGPDRDGCELPASALTGAAYAALARICIATLLGFGCAAAADGLTEARRLWQDGESERAIAVLRAALIAHPDDAEMSGTLGQYLGLQGETAEGERLIRAAIAREPANPDHQLRLAMVLRRAGRGDDALAAAESACRLAPDSSEAAAVRDSLRPDQRRWRLDVGGSIDRYSARRDDENEVFVSLARTIVPGVAVVAGVDQQHRYGLDDQRYDLSLYGPIGTAGSGWVRIGVSPGNQFLPDHEEEVAGDVAVLPILRPGLRLTHRSFPGEDIYVPRPSLRWDPHPLLGIEAAYLWAISDVQPTTRSAEVRLYVNDGGRLAGSLGFSSGEENNPPLPIGQVDVYSASLSWRATRDWGLRLDASHEIREALYTRNGLGLAVTTRF
ncbi:MAG: YaiO family outer membrane beta-barrel protein [Planctomycetes bacterium]|nr:YaiO family outer membrane beta-barrel protein [Planctomycetota bacterium]